MVYVRAGRACHQLGVDRRTLVRWADTNQISYIQPGGDGRQRLFDVASVIQRGNAVSCGESTTPTAVDVIYGRVSTRKQLGNLKRQLDDLSIRFPDHRVISDCASGLNYNRKGLKTLLELCFAGRLRTVRVTHRDRLCRFGFDLIEHILKKHGARIVVEDDGDHSAESDLADDIISVITVFGARLYGRRSGEGKRRKASKSEGGRESKTDHTE